MNDRATEATNGPMPSLFIPHGGGPCFFVEWDPPETWAAMRNFLAGLTDELNREVSAIVIVSAHWLTRGFKTTGARDPELIYDYEGFPPHTYQLQYAAPGSPELAKRIAHLLSDAGLDAAVDENRGWDHGVFIPLKVMFPDANIPVVALSLDRSLDPALHLAAGRALAPLRDEGVLIIGSGMSFHDLRGFFSAQGDGAARQFDDWLAIAASTRSEVREDLLKAWATAPGGRAAHPHEDHLLPMMVASGAAYDEPGTQIFTGNVMGKAVSAFSFG